MIRSGNIQRPRPVPSSARHDQLWRAILSRSVLAAVALHVAAFIPRELMEVDLLSMRSPREHELLLSSMVALPGEVLVEGPRKRNAAPPPIPPRPELSLDLSTMPIPPILNFKPRIPADLLPPPGEAEQDEWAGYERISPVVHRPEIRNRREVELFLSQRYRAIQRRTRATGTAMLLFWIDETGMPQRVDLDRSSGHALLDELAQEVPEVIRFKPALRGGEPIRVIVLVPVRFSAAGTQTVLR